MNERPEEYAFVFKSIAHAGPTTVLDVGTGMTSLPLLIKTCDINVTAIDNDKDRVANNHYCPIILDDIMNSKLTGKFDLITCISVLEHITSYDLAVKSMAEKINRNGFLVLTFPYNELRFVSNNYDLPNAGYRGRGTICRSFSRKQIDEWTTKFNMEIVFQEYWRIFSGNDWTVGRRVNPPTPSTKDDPHHLTCILLRKIISKNN